MSISEDDKAVFKAAMEGVKAYQNEGEVTENAKALIPKKKKVYIRSQQNDFQEDITDKTQAPRSVSATDILSYNKTGKAIKKIQRYAIEATLDLHEHTSEAALAKLHTFILSAQKNKQRMVRIIHGKGRYANPQRPILKNLVNHFLQSHDAVTAFHSEKNNTGAVIVLLKMLK